MIPPIASNFVAGETPSEALDHVADLNARGVKGICNLLGEHYDDRADADADADAYIDLAERIARRDVDACLSVKPSQIGLEVGDRAFEENLARIVDAADCFVWIDMEDHDTVDVTLDAFERHARETDGNVGVCVQANLKRTGETLERLADCPGKVRLVKGAYDPPASIAYKEKSKVDEMYREYLTYMFEHFEDGIAVGSHDPAMIEFARDLHDEHGTPFEIQMLTGVREDAQFELAEEYEVYQYIPYGSKWFSYFYRRVRERKENALFALRAVVGA
ncbi:proline dehydrogenase family protein [Haloarcula onubensis]|uniref:proline dehydrogenase n=1 Tax=Haloarcula onubensis TaxID=2950539 RepID=A0ABU2FS25_9EURY|nr:proline dehydrogenase family protein [Halomicroarcula sp. S3CR25-11]MDS0283082.1 proline dehydrogenase family protein [Halomicroarcula sp. S3CR25-11]